MEIITIKLDSEMLKRIDAIVKENNYGTRTEFIRSSVREKMSQIEKQELIKQVLALKGSSKTKTTDKELRRIREEVSEELLKEYKLK